MDYQEFSGPPPDLPSPKHFQPWAIGMDPQIGGMGTAEWQTWTPSNILIPKATEAFTPAAQAYFKNRKLNRSAPPGYLDTADGEYTRSGSIYARRMKRDGSYPTADDEQHLVRHELLHAASAEHAPFLADYNAGLPALRKALADSGWAIPAAVENDPAHIFTGAAEAVILGNAPPALRGYFAPLLR